MAQTLQELGFELVGGGAQIDFDKPGFETAVKRFGLSLQGADVGLFYYAGHGATRASSAARFPGPSASSCPTVK